MNHKFKRIAAIAGAGVLSLGAYHTVSGEDHNKIKSPFSDIDESSPIFETMENVYYMDIMTGYLDRSGWTYEMRPYEDVTRAQAAKMITASLGVEMATQEKSSFTDVTERYWAHDYITIMAERNIFGGYEDGTFDPQDTLTRVQAAKIIVNTFDLPFSESDRETGFKDVPADHWAAAYVNALVESDITTGTSQTTFEPEEDVTRYQLAAFIDRSFNTVELSEDQILLEVRNIYSEFRSHYMEGLHEATQTETTFNYEDLKNEIDHIITEGYEPIVKKNFTGECAHNGDCDGIRYTATMDLMFNKNVIEYSEDRITIQYDEDVHGLTPDANYIISLAKEDGKWKLDNYEVKYYQDNKLSLNLTKEQALNHIEATFRLYYSMDTDVYSITDLGTNEDGDYLMQLNTDGAYQDVIRFDVEEGSFYY
ncbi:S-layer homology domain-containing protein [Jeotgalibacillus salarius]|uniref:S-layer homology domain-containing protein n=1 Tax=Jeotgalibacillus salarius TaxID=546023 RepID=A0A4Y8LNT9_9BACL|nr:S-layer homology domain-containing protein [Jeotgalibacillus salarius]TFE04077.1 S-layer homology domain-containing protein [Jeotgalibacillus salarius]